VDSYGKEINRRTVQVQYFTEDKISLPSGAKMIEMSLIPKGKFDMGMSTQERQIALESGLKDDPNRENLEKWLDASTPIQNITFAQPFYMSRYAVTQAQWLAVMGKFTDAFNKRDDANFNGYNRPMVMVNWSVAKAYCKKLSELTGKNYRLPSEAEWEYSCRANTKTPFYFGETITADLVNHDSNFPYANTPKNASGYRRVTTDVGSFPPNEWGLYDVHGNVLEWCEDVWHNNYDGIPKDGSAWLKDGEQNKHTVRGGSWGNLAISCRSAIRFRFDTDFSDNFLGFRVVI
jgi:formylglycine-generating enzyme required for sulfatase activity